MSNSASLLSGFRELDELTKGWSRSELIVVAGRPAMGKTAFTVSVAKRMAIDLGIPIAIFSLEMSKEQYMKRFEMARFQLNNAPIYIDDTDYNSRKAFGKRIKELIDNHGVQCVFVDYLQLISVKAEDLKALAVEFNIPIIALSQLPRNVDDVHYPSMSDLRGHFAQILEADKILFLYRPEYYHIYQNEDGEDMKGVIEVILAKDSNAQIGTARLRFNSDLVILTDN